MRRAILDLKASTVFHLHGRKNDRETSFKDSGDVGNTSTLARQFDRTKRSWHLLYSSRYIRSYSRLL